MTECNFRAESGGKFGGKFGRNNLLKLADFSLF